MKRKPNHAGLRRWYPNPLTGNHIGVYDGEPAGMDTEGGRWQTVCEEHGSICSHDTLTLAKAHAHDVAGWCEDCMKLAEKTWPEGILRRVSREAYDAITRSRGFDFMTPEEREAAALSYDRMLNPEGR